MDFTSTTLAPGRRLELLTVVDTFTREALPIESAPRSWETGEEVLDRLIIERGVQSEEIVLDNGLSGAVPATIIGRRGGN